MAEPVRVPEEYGAGSVEVRKGPKAVRKRPGCISATPTKGRGRTTSAEVVDNGIDDALAGRASEVRVTLHADNSVNVSDYGRGRRLQGPSADFLEDLLQLKLKIRTVNHWPRVHAWTRLWTCRAPVRLETGAEYVEPA